MSSYQYYQYLKFIKQAKTPPLPINAGTQVITAKGPITFSDNNIGLMYSSPLALKDNAITLDTTSDITLNGAVTFNGTEINMANIPLVSGDIYNVTIDPYYKRLAYQSLNGTTIQPSLINMSNAGTVQNVVTLKGKDTNPLTISSSNLISKMILDNSGNVSLTGNTITIGNPSSIVNIQGTSTSVQSSTVTNQRIVLNKNGNTASSYGSGIEIEANGVNVGYIKTNSTGTEYDVKVPSSSTINTMMLKDSNGNMNMTGNLSINTNKFIVNSSTGDLTVGGSATILKDINMNGLLTCVSGCYVVGTVDVFGNSNLSDTKVNKTLDVSGNTTLKNTSITGALNVTGTTTTTGNNTITGDLNISNNAYFGNGVLSVIKNTVGGTMFLTGNSTVTGQTQLNNVSLNGSLTATNPLAAVNVAGGTYLNKELHVGGAFDTCGNSLLKGDLTVYGKSSLNDEVYIGSNVYVNGLNCNVTISGDTYIGNNATINGTAVIQGNTLLKDNVYIDGRTRIYNLVDISGVATISEATILKKTLDVSGVATFDGGMKLNNLPDGNSYGYVMTYDRFGTKNLGYALASSFGSGGGGGVSVSSGINTAVTNNVIDVSINNTLDMFGNGLIGISYENFPVNVNIQQGGVPIIYTSSQTLNLKSTTINLSGQTLNVYDPSICFHNIPSASKSDVVYYDSSTKSISYGPQSSGSTYTNLTEYNSNIGIGTTTPAYKLEVSGKTFLNYSYTDISHALQTKFDGSGNNSNYGYSVSVSSDGLTLAIGAPQESTGSSLNNGAVYVYTRNSVSVPFTTFSSATPNDVAATKLLNDDINNGQFGTNVSLSSNGLTLAVYANNNSVGAVYIFTRSSINVAFTQYNPASPNNPAATKLNGTAFSNFGYSLSLSSDGLTLAIGANGITRVYIYTRTNTSSAFSTNIQITGSNNFGYSVSLSSDGLILAVSAPSYTGAVYVFSRPNINTSFSTDINSATLLSTGITNGNFGLSLTLSSDGLTLAVGTYIEASTGAVYIYNRISTETSFYTYTRISTGITNSSFGNSVSLSSNGLILAVSAMNETSNKGAVYIYSRTSTSSRFPVNYTTRLETTFNNGNFGRSLSLSSDGLILAIGSSNENSIGAARIYKKPELEYTLDVAGNTRCSTGVWISSDKRIKNNVVDIDDGNALSILRKIQPKTYEYVDKKSRGNNTVIGFIAQEIQEVIPNACTISKDYIPNFYTTCQIAHTDVYNILLVTSQSDINWDDSTGTLINESGQTIPVNQVFNIKLYDQHNSEIKCKTTSILDKRSFLIDATNTKLLTDTLHDEYLLYGQEVNDFHNLDKSAVFTVVTAAVQDIDRIMQSDAAKINDLQSKNATLTGEVASLTGEIATLTTEVASLTSQLSTQDARIVSLEAAIQALLNK